jgi:hypothetical protein
LTLAPLRLEHSIVLYDTSINEYVYSSIYHDQLLGLENLIEQKKDLTKEQVLESLSYFSYAFFENKSDDTLRPLINILLTYCIKDGILAAFRKKNPKTPFYLQVVSYHLDEEWIDLDLQVNVEVLNSDKPIIVEKIISKMIDSRTSQNSQQQA